MNSYWQIQNLVHRYAESFDLGDFEALAELFEYGEINWMSGMWRKRGFDAVLEMTRAAIRIYQDTGTPCTRHMIANLIIEVDEEEGVAQARSTFMMYRERLGEPVLLLCSGRHHDEFEQVEGRWTFKERTVLTDYYADLSEYLLISMAGPMGDAH